MTLRLSCPTWLSRDTYGQFVQSQVSRCAACKTTDVLLTIDHIVSRHEGGDDSLSNLQWLCGPCNSRKSDRPDGYWGRQFFFDQRPNFAHARVAQQEIFDQIVAIPEFYGQPFSQFNRLLYLLVWATGVGKTLAIAIITAALNHVARQQRGPAAPRADRILVLAKEVAIRDQLKEELATEIVEFGLYPVAPRVQVLEWRRAQSLDFLDTADIWVCCLQQLWDSHAGPTETERLRLLAKFPAMHFDEPHWAPDQVAALVDGAWSSLCLGYTASPMTGTGSLLRSCVVLHQYDYRAAVENDSCMKYVASTSEPYIFKEIQPVDYDVMRQGIVNSGGEVAHEPDYKDNIRPAIDVAMEVISTIADADAMQAVPDLLRHPTLAPHRDESRHIPTLRYPVHGLIIVDAIQIAEQVARHINDYFQQHRAMFPRASGWHAEVVHSGDWADGVTKYRIASKPLGPDHSWHRARRHEMDASCSRILLVVGMGREGMNNTYCGVVGLATTTNSLIELIQRVIGRQIRAVIKQRSDIIEVPNRLDDQIRIISHRSYDVRQRLDEAIEFVLNMQDKFEGLPTVQQIIAGEQLDTAKIPEDDSYLSMTEKIEIACRFGTGGEHALDDDQIGKWTATNSKKAERVKEWIHTVKTDPLSVWNEIRQGRLRDRGVILREAFRSNPTLEELRRFLAMRLPELRQCDLAEGSDSLLLARTLYEDHYRQFIVSALHPTTDIDRIRKRVAAAVRAQLGQSLNASEHQQVTRIIFQAVAVATKDTLGVSERVEKGGRYDRPEVHAILLRPDVQREMNAFARTELIRAGYVPALEWCVPDDAKVRA